MAEKKGKRPKHTRLVVPGSGVKRRQTGKDRLGRSMPNGAGVPPETPGEEPGGAGRWPAGRLRRKKETGMPAGRAAEDGTARPGVAAEPSAQSGADPLLDDAVRIPTGKKAIRLPGRLLFHKPHGRVAAARRRKMFRRLRRAAVAVVAALIILFFSSGAYLTAAGYLSDVFDNLYMTVRPGDGFPMNFGLNGFLDAQAMDGGFAVLGENEMAVISPTGAELRRIKHGYVNPGFSAGDTRVVLYSRGGKEYTVENRGKTLTSLVVEQDIQFAEMSPGGWLALVTASRFRTDLMVYDPTYDAAEAPVFSWQINDVKPVLADFAANNRQLLLGCVTARNGGISSVLYLLRLNREEILAEIWQDDAMLLRAEYMEGGRVLALYDELAVVYEPNGEEAARYEYGGRHLLAADVSGRQLALVFASAARGSLHVVALDTELALRFSQDVEGDGAADVLCVGRDVIVLSGRQAVALSGGGSVLAARTFGQDAQALVDGGQPLLLLRGQVVPLAEMLQPAAESGGSG